MRISHFAVAHPVVIGMLMIVLVAFGIYSFIGMNIEFMADISLPTVEVLAVYPGAGAEDVERDVTDVLEKDFSTLPNFTHIDSTSTNSFSWITITFRDGIDPYEMLDDIRNRIRQLESDLPDNLEGEPVAIVGSATMLPVFMFSLSSGRDSVILSSYVEETLVPRITRIPGVAEVELEGIDTLQAHVELRTKDLLQTGIPAIQVHQAIQYANMRMPVGSMEYHGNTASLRYDGSISSLEELGEIPIGATDGKKIVRLSQVADITFDTAEKSVYADANGDPKVVVTVTKRTDGNTLEIVDGIRNVLEQVTAETGSAITYEILSDDSRNVKASLFTVVRSGMVGMLMAIIVILLFLGDTRATVTIALSIPLSILFTFIGMRIVGVTVNLMSLSGMVVALGLVVDGSIVMLEQVSHAYTQKGLSPKEAIGRGADEVGSPILASTTTTVAVFIPLSMLSGIVGSILRDVAVTLILSLTASLFVALVVVPYLLTLVLRSQRRVRRAPRFGTYIETLGKGYRRALKWSLGASPFVLLAAILLLALVAFAAGSLGITFIPSTDNGDFNIDLEFPQGYSVERTRQKALEAQQLVTENIGEIESIVLFSGQGSGYGFASPHRANMKVVLVPVDQRERTIHEIIIEVQKLLASSVVDAKVRTTNGGFDALVGFISGGGGYGLKLVGEDVLLLYETAEKIRSELAKDPDVLSTSIDTSYDANTLVMDMSHRLMSNLGVSSAEAGLTARLLFNGIDVGTLVDDSGIRHTIHMDSDLKNLPLTSDTLLSATVPSSGGTAISFASIAQLETRREIARITHTDRAKTVTVSADLVSEDTSGIGRRMAAYLESNPLPPGVESASGGLIELLVDSIEPMATALSIAIFLVYTVMVVQFERFRQPLVIMASIPFCLIGVVFGLASFGSTLSLISFTAIIALGGIVVNNGIILIDAINSLRQDGTNGDDPLAILHDAVIEGGSSRLRPILMTTLTTLLGVVPMAFATGEGAAIYAPLGQAIAGGLFSSTLITLFFIPILYHVTERHVILRSKKGRRDT
jgi:HAE1 family hydrophobic/amphiphilic exporter-1